MSFAWPWLFALLPLPWLVRRRLPPRLPAVALRVPARGDFAPPSAGGPLPRQPVCTGARRAALVAWALLVIAAARPQWVGDAGPLPVSGRDLMIALDVSASMGTADLSLDAVPVERLHAARTLAADFVGRRDGDRVGLIVFGNQAYLHTPLTFDLAAVRAALAQTAVGLAGRETALGDAVALAAGRLSEFAGSDKVLILLTDGANTAGVLTPQQAAWIAARARLRIHVLHLGAPPRRDGTAPAAPDADEELLRMVARQTAGTYHRATDYASLRDFYRSLDDIEPVERLVASLRPVRALHAWPLGAALALVVAMALARLRKRR